MKQVAIKVRGDQGVSKGAKGEGNSQHRGWIFNMVWLRADCSESTGGGRGEWSREADGSEKRRRITGLKSRGKNG